MSKDVLCTITQVGISMFKWYLYEYPKELSANLSSSNIVEYYCTTHNLPINRCAWIEIPLLSIIKDTQNLENYINGILVLPSM